ncbi:MAG: hypothetical protein GY863_04555 [bacterium]|nr:hypothetical protein [bacterium]
MKKNLNNSIIGIIVVLVSVLFVFSTASFAQEKKADDAGEKYVGLVGEYEFDLSEFGQANQTIRVYVENDALMIEGEDGEADVMEPVEDKEFEFSVEDPMQGTITFRFVKDEEGKFNQVIAIIEMAGVEVTGTRIDDGQ